tara:strand:+ start:468 stop:1511 length:1044 start_codon:yes stop_codon:yes gene_type:complete
MALSKILPAGQSQFAGARNLIINGDFQCWQRATAATAGAHNTLNTVDRWAWLLSNDGAVTSEQSTDTPTGTGYSFLLKCTTADTSLAAGQYAGIFQNIEAQNLQPLQYGTSSAKTITLSFWAKSNKTGTYTVALYKAGNTGYIIPNEYTISSANTWEKKTITITPTAGNTSFITASAAAFLNNNTLGFQVAFNLAFGSTFHGTNNTWSSNASHYSTSNQVNWMDSTSNNFYLAQVQLEIGDVATPFEHEDFGTALAKCQRYYTYLNYMQVMGYGYGTGGDGVGSAFSFPTTMRATPAMSKSGEDHGGSNSSLIFNYINNVSCSLEAQTTGSNHSVWVVAYVTADAEL